MIWRFATSVVGAFILTISPALAQQAVLDGGPFRATDGNNVYVSFVSGKAPTTKPTAPVKAWAWTVYAFKVASCDCDADATLMTFNCATRQVTFGQLELFLGTKFVGARKSTQVPTVAGPTGLLGEAMNAVCNPSYEALATYPDFTAAYAAAVKHLKPK